MYKKLLPLAIIAALAIASTAGITADPIDHLEGRAEGGDVHAQVKLGEIYLNGDGVPRDTDRGLTWLTRASEGPRADARAALLLAEHYERQPATPANRGHMIQFYRRAAVLGHTTAQARLGKMLLASATDKRLNPASQAEAREKGRAMLEHAANAGNAQAASALADAYRHGDGLPENPQQAMRFDRRAADLGDITAAMRLSQRLLDSQSPDFQPVQGAQYLRMAANAGVPRAMGELARRLSTGEGVVKDIDQARDWARKASEKGDEPSASLLVTLRDQAPAPASARTTALISTSPPQVPPTSAHGQMRFVVTLGSFANLANANVLMTRLRNTGLPVYDENVTVSGRTLTRLRAGPYASRQDADQASHAIRQNHPDLSVVVAALGPNDKTPEPSVAAAPKASIEAAALRVPPITSDLAPAPTLTSSRDDKEAIADLAFDANGDTVFDDIGGKTYDQLLEEVANLQATVKTQQTTLATLRMRVAEQEQTIAALTTERDNALAIVRSIEQTLGAPARALPASGSKAPAAPSKPTAAATIAAHDDDGSKANDRGLAALRAGDASAARGHFEAAALAGHAGAMNNLAMLYMQGRGVRPSMAQAIEHFTKAAESGNGVAANNLGFIYQTGRGVAPDRALAIAWYQRAVRLGHKASDRQLRAMGVPATTTIAAN